MPWGAAIIGGSVLASTIGSTLAAGSAANAEENGANQVINYANGIYNTANTNLQPYMQTGQTANTLLNQDLPSLSQGFDPTVAQLDATPGYQFELQQGLEATQAGYAAQGLGVSGASMKGAANYATGTAENTYNDLANIYNTNRTTTADILQSGAGLGEGAASSLASTGEAGLGAVTGGITGAANAQAAADTAPYTAASNGLNSLLQMYMLQNSGLLSGNTTNTQSVSSGTVGGASSGALNTVSGSNSLLSNLMAA